VLRIFLSGVTAAAAATAMTPAQAVSFHMQGATASQNGALHDPGVAAGEQIVAGFDGQDTVSIDFAHSTGYDFYTGSHSGVAAAPVGDSSRYVAIATGGDVLFDLRSFAGAGNHITSVSAYLGSVDPYNFIDVLGIGASGNIDAGHPLLTIGGSDLLGDNGDWYSSLTNGRLTISFDASEHIGGLVFRSTGVAFEFDSIAVGTGRPLSAGQTPAAVPEPASWAMMLGGFGLVGGAMRARRKAGVSFA